MSILKFPFTACQEYLVAAQDGMPFQESVGLKPKRQFTKRQLSKEG